MVDAQVDATGERLQLPGTASEWPLFVESLDSLPVLLAHIRQVRDGRTSFDGLERGVEILAHGLDDQASRATFRQPNDLHSKALEAAAQADPG